MISPGFVVSVLATLFAAWVTAVLIFEDWAVWHSDKSGKPDKATRRAMRLSGDNTITAWTRYYERLLDQHHKSHWLTIAVLVLGLVLGHLLWH